MPSNSYIVSRPHDHEDRIEEAGVGTVITATIDIDNNSIINLALPVNNKDAVPLVTFNNGLNTKLCVDGSIQMSGDLNIGGKKSL